MSYAYKVKLERLTGVIEQAGVWQPSLMHILSSDEMAGLFRQALIDIGWIESAGHLSLEVDGIRCELATKGTEIRAVISEEVYAEQTVIGDTDDSPTLKKARLSEGKKRQADKLEKVKEAEIRKVTEKLMSIEAKVKAQMDLASHQTHAKALEIKAGRLGEIKSTQTQVAEDGTLEVTIHVNLN
jgi:hypothetical protein